MRLKIICLNIWIGGILFDEAVSFLKSQQPDIVLLQEAYNGEDSSLATQHRTYTALKEQLQFPYSHFASAFLEELNGQYIQQGNAILSKYPLEELAVVFYDEPFGVRDNRRAAFHQTPRNLQHVVVDVQDTKLHLLNTQGIWGKDGEDSPRRLAMSETILAEVVTSTCSRTPEPSKTLKQSCKTSSKMKPKQVSIYSAKTYSSSLGMPPR